MMLMGSQKTLNIVKQWNFQDDSNPPGIYNKGTVSSSVSRILDIERAEQAESAALTQYAEMLCTSQKAHSNAVLEKLGFSIQHDTIPSPQLPAYPGRNPESSLQEWRIRPISSLLNVEDSNIGRTPDEEDLFFDIKLRMGSQMAINASKLAKLTAKNRTPSPHTSINSVDTLSSVDTHTPSDLRAISPLSNITPTPPPTAGTRRVSRIPVMSVKLGGVGKEVADGCKLQSAKIKVEKLLEKVEQLQLVHFHSPQPVAVPRRPPAALRRPPAALGRPAALRRPPTALRRPPTALGRPAALRRAPAALRRTPAPLRRTPAPLRRHLAAVTPMVLTFTTAAQTNRKGPFLGTNLYSLKADSAAGWDDLQPLVSPSESLSLLFKKLSSEDWKKKVDRLKSVRVLARHHQELLKTKLHEVCRVLTEEVSNTRSAVACAAVKAIADLHINLGKAMDPEAERIGRVLLLKLAQTTEVFIHQQVKLALDALVQGCSPSRIISGLLNTGLRHRCNAVRGSTAQHLHQLADIIGEERIFATGKLFAERFLTAVSRMSVDAAPKVRYYGHKMLHGLAHQTEFMVLWNKVIPVEDRHSLQKILMKIRQ